MKQETKRARSAIIALAGLVMLWAAVPVNADQGAGELNASFHGFGSGGLALEVHSEVAANVASPQLSPDGRLSPFGDDAFICDQLVVGTWIVWFADTSDKEALAAVTNEFVLDGEKLELTRTPLKRFNNPEEKGWWFAFSGDGAAEVITDQLSRPTGILFLPDGRLLVADAGPNAIFEVLDDGSVEEFSRHRLFHEPQGLALDDNGNIYVANFANGRLQRISPTGEIEELHQFDDALIGLLHLDGALYIAGRGDWVVFRYELETGAVELVANATGEALRMFAPVSLAAGPDGEIYLTHETPTSVGVLTPVG